jgi:radical SAM/Cys-rich protein
MDELTLASVSRIAREVQPALVDITGGSPELHPGLPALASQLRSAGLRTQVRTNLTALLEPDAEGVIDHLAGSGVQLLASVPALTAERYASQRGDHWQAALTALRRLNDAGWARSGDLRLDLAVDSSGYGEQCSARELAARYRAVLTDNLGIGFNQLVLMTTMPIGRFRTALERRGEYQSYVAGLAGRFNPATVANLACRTAIEIAWDGTLADCDFNLAAGLRTAEGEPAHISEFDSQRLARRRIRFAQHCWACTAGEGSG